MQFKHIDLLTLKRIFNDDLSKVRQWIGLYLEEAPGLFERLSECCSNEDADGLVSVAHDLRPQAHYLGAEHMLELLVALGQRAPAGGAVQCKDLVDELLALSIHVDKELREALQGT